MPRRNGQHRNTARHLFARPYHLPHDKPNFEWPASRTRQRATARSHRARHARPLSTRARIASAACLQWSLVRARCPSSLDISRRRAPTGSHAYPTTYRQVFERFPELGLDLAAQLRVHLGGLNRVCVSCVHDTGEHSGRHMCGGGMESGNLTEQAEQDTRDTHATLALSHTHLQLHGARHGGDGAAMGLPVETASAGWARGQVQGRARPRGPAFP